ncbi:hypothetical protein H4W30_004130 [Amycolatopsis roodepoortensis]|uniref:Uncharacterized protein n=1 Tax=Amycolatopsis roodepoortensis TaxID=700274 RepID=A0ABR9L8W9_9PSEU|nr:hypothetical protein [Amycolatopsis roodepoortensis]
MSPTAVRPTRVAPPCFSMKPGPAGMPVSVVGPEATIV